MKKDLKKYINKLIDNGWTLEHGKKTFKLRSPKGGLVSCSRTPSCPFAIKHIEADIKRVIRREQNEI